METQRVGYCVVDNVTDNVVDKLSERQKDIIRILSNDVVDNVVENATTLSHRLGVSHRTIQRDLEYLKKLNVIRRVGTDRGGHWEVISKQNQ